VTDAVERDARSRPLGLLSTDADAIDRCDAVEEGLVAPLAST
jgi:hypothetical protein